MPPPTSKAKKIRARINAGVEQGWEPVGVAECRAKLEAMRAAGKPITRRVRFIIIDCSGENRD